MRADPPLMKARGQTSQKIVPCTGHERGGGHDFPLRADEKSPFSRPSDRQNNTPSASKNARRA